MTRLEWYVSDGLCLKAVSNNVSLSAMPNTLVHVAVHSAVLTPLRVPFAAVLAGSVIPDVPWIVRRLLNSTGLDLPPIEMFAYFIALSSLFGCIALCFAVAVLFSNWRLVFGVSALGCLIHLLIDSLQDKWGVGVHLLAPIDWYALSLANFPIESTATQILTVAGAVSFFFLAFRNRDEARLLALDSRRIAACGLCLVAYFSLPVLVIDDVIASDSRYLHTLMNSDERTGKPIQLDREPLMQTEGKWQTTTHTGENLVIVNPDDAWTPDTIYSFRATFQSEADIVVSEWKSHTEFRDVASYVGLFLIITWFTALAVSRVRNQDQAYVTQNRTTAG